MSKNKIGNNLGREDIDLPKIESEKERARAEVPVKKTVETQAEKKAKAETVRSTAQAEKENELTKALGAQVAVTLAEKAQRDAEESARLAAEAVKEAVSPNDSERKARWGKHVANYQKANPVKYAYKKARGEFDQMPVNFK